MSKTWYYEVMGSELGPISSSDLIDKAKRGQIQPDTRVRSGPEGKWQFAERVKGLFPAPPVPPPPKPMVVASPPPPAESPDIIRLAGSRNSADADDATYHFSGESAQHTAGSSAQSESQVFEFFEFIGFRQAISSKLYDVLMVYVHDHHLSVTQVTRRALAEFLGRKDLAEDAPSGVPAESPPAVTSAG